MSDGVVALVTGANGFIGQRLCYSLLNEAVAFRGMVRVPKGDCHHVLGDIRDVESLVQICQSIDTVFHCAGYGAPQGTGRRSV